MIARGHSSGYNNTKLKIKCEGPEMDSDDSRFDSVMACCEQGNDPSFK
jgi:hypothetical protein